MVVVVQATVRCSTRIWTQEHNLPAHHLVAWLCPVQLIVPHGNLNLCLFVNGLSIGILSHTSTTTKLQLFVVSSGYKHIQKRLGCLQILQEGFVYSVNWVFEGELNQPHWASLYSVSPRFQFYILFLKRLNSPVGVGSVHGISFQWSCSRFRCYYIRLKVTLVVVRISEFRKSVNKLWGWMPTRSVSEKSVVQACIPSPIHTRLWGVTQIEWVFRPLLTEYAKNAQMSGHERKMALPMRLRHIG